MKAILVSVGTVLLALLGAACVEQGYGDFPQDYLERVDARAPDAQAAPDALVDGASDAEPTQEATPYRPQDPQGPQVVFVEPTTGDTVAGERLTVRAQVSDPDGVDMETVRVYVPGGEPSPMARAGLLQDEFDGTLDGSGLAGGALLIVVEAADLLGHLNSAEVEVVLDPGPRIDVTTPVEAAAYGALVDVSLLLCDDFGLLPSTVQIELDGVPVGLTLMQQDNLNGDEPRWMLLGGAVDLRGAAFTAPLSGGHALTVRVTNVHGVLAQRDVAFVVDGQGPTIDVRTPLPGQIVGGVIDIAAVVEDASGVAPGSVVAVLAHDSDQYVVSLSLVDGTYIGAFDTQLFPTDGWYYPSISVRAADLFANESAVGHQVVLDNRGPVLSFGECASTGSATGCGPSTHRVPQLFFIRPHIEDPGITGPGMVGSYAAQTDDRSAYVYLLPGDGRALVVDTDGDGYCDAINPTLAPSTTPQTAQEVLALSLAPVPPTDATAQADPSEPVCEGAGGMTEVPGSALDPSVPVIFSLPPVLPGDAQLCTGMQFDAVANNVPEGWLCLAVAAADRLGNVGVSPPWRTCLDYTGDGLPVCDTCQRPDCTGTYDPVTQTVDPTTPCVFGSAQMLP